MIRSLLFDSKSRALSVVRRGPRTVLWAPEWMGFGNWLYLWLWADTGRRRGADRLVLHQPQMEPWLEAFPALRQLTVARSRVAFRDRRHTELFGHGRYGESFTTDELGSFIERHLVPGVAGFPAPSPGDVVINVRRGDYYSNPQFEAEFGFDQVEYIRRAIALLRGDVTSFVVVSDDPVWCAEHLGILRDVASVRLGGAGRDPLSDFRTLATARRSILTNSTFSYWGGYTAGVLYRESNDVCAPSFFSRRQNRGRSWHLDPRWRVVEIPVTDSA
jgi:hypothetical protein